MWPKTASRRQGWCSDWRLQFCLLTSYACMHAQSLSSVPLFVTPWTVARQAPLVRGISQARILEWIAISFSNLICNLSPKFPSSRFFSLSLSVSLSLSLSLSHTHSLHSTHSTHTHLWNFLLSEALLESKQPTIQQTTMQSTLQNVFN